MADWIETDDPGIVASPAGQEVPRALVPPTDRIVPRQAAPAPMGPPVAPGGDMPTAVTPAVQSTLAKLDDPRIAAARGQGASQLPIAQQSTTTQSGVPMSALKPVMDRGTARADSQAQAVTQLGEEKARTGEQQAMTAATAAYGQMQTSQAEAEQASQRAEIARQNQLAIAAQDDPSIDPDRFVRGMSTGQSVGTIILAAIEGAFRGMSGQPGQSGVLNILERRIDQDLMAQKEQIASGRIRRGNMISYFQQQGMSEEAAEKAAKAMAFAQSEKLVQAEIARQGAGMARPEAAALAEQIKAAREQANDELMLANQPRSSTTTVRQAPGGGDGDGFSKLLAARKAYEESGASPEQLAAFDKANGMGAMAPAGESVTAQNRRTKDESRTEIEGKAGGTIKLLDELGSQLGLAQDPGGKGFREDPSNKSIISKRAGEEIASGFSFGYADNPIEATENALIESFGRLQSGGVISPSEEQRFGSMIRDAKTDAQRAIALNAIRPIIEAKLNPRDRKQGGVEAAGFKRVAP
jgi:hypothetical protein